MQRPSISTQGNAILLALMITLILAALLFVQAMATRANLQITAQRTANAQNNAQAIFSTVRKLQTVLTTLPTKTTHTVDATALSGVSNFSALQDTVPTWLPCRTATTDTRLFIADLNTCGASNTSPTQVTQNTRGGTTNWTVPLLLTLTNHFSDGSQRTKQVSGTLRFTSAPQLNVTAFQLYANSLTESVPGKLIFDGPVHINGRISLDAARSAWPGGLTSSAQDIAIGGITLKPTAFAPNPSLPCDQTSVACPQISGGLGLNTLPYPVPDPATPSGGLNLPANVREIILFPTADGSNTGFFACNTTQCDVYQFTGTNNTLERIQSGVPVPARGGAAIDTTPTEHTAIAGVTQSLLLTPGAVEVRSLIPTGTAYRGSLTIQAHDTLTIGSSLLAAHPVCTTYPVLDTSGNIQPAVCASTSSLDGLGLISTVGNIQIGQANFSLGTDETSFTLQADLLAPRGLISVADSRLVAVDWIGTASANQFKPDSRLRLAHDPRALKLPGFPSFSADITPARVTFDLERGLD